MADLFHNLGVDWRLLVSQGVNFLLLLIILRLFVYKPLLKVLADRRARIEEGLAKADEADKRLSEANEIAKTKLKEAEHAGMNLIAEARDKATHDKAEAEKRLKSDETAARERLAQELRRREAESADALAAAQGALVKAALIKTVELSPEAVDDALISKALSHVKQTA